MPKPHTLQTITPYPDVNQVLNLLLAQAGSILGVQMIGLYLYGSLSSGDFDPRSSDIDFVFVTETSLPPAIITALEAMHQGLWASGSAWAARLEGAYVPKSLIRRHNPQGPTCPGVNEGMFYHAAQLGSDWIIQRHILREQGLVLSGPAPRELIDPVSAEDIRQAVSGVLHEWWQPILDDPSWLGAKDSTYHAYAVISMCRALYALQHASIVSKPVAARWAQQAFPVWRGLIAQALRAQYGGQPGFLDEALRFIRFTVER